MPADIEEVVIGRGLVAVEHRAPQLSQTDLGGRHRQPPDRWPGSAIIWLRQRRSIQLPVRGQRQSVQDHEHRRNHVAREYGPDAVPHLRDVDLPTHQVSHQSGVTTPILDGHDRLRHADLSDQRRLDLAEFDPESTKLDLMIGPADEHEGSVRPVTNHVAGAVPALRRTEAPLDETLLGEIGATEVAGRQSVAGQPKLTGDADRAPVPSLVDHCTRHVGDGPTHRNRPGLPTVEPAADRPHRGLGRAVEVPDLPHPGHQGIHQVRAVSLASAHDAQGGPARPTGLAHHSPGRRRRLDQVGPDIVEEPGQRARVPSHLGGRQHQRCPRHERQEQVGNRQVERRRGRPDHDVTGDQARSGGHLGQDVDHSPVGDDDSLRPARRARGIDHVRHAVGGHLNARIGWVLGDDGGTVGIDIDHRSGVIAQTLDKGRAGDHRGDRGVGQHERHTVLGIVRVERHVGSPGTLDTNQRRDEIHRPVEEHPHPITGGDTESRQMSTQTGRGRIQLGEGEGPTPGIPHRKRRPMGFDRSAECGDQGP